MLPNIVGYHANDIKKIPDTFPEDTFIVANDTDWLGDGMYFWDNLGNAQYWVRKKRREKIKEICIIKANLIIDEFLDLTDYEIISRIEKIWIDYCKLKRINHKNYPLGVKLNRLFEFFDDFCQKYKVIKAIGFYKSRSEHNFFIYETENNNFPYITSQIKTIYCVKSSEKIVCLTKEWCNEDEKE